MFGTKFASIHTGQSYLPVLMTALCYGPHFPFTNISQIITQRLYEASLLQRWINCFLNESINSAHPTYSAPIYTQV
ncbi:unnamed protein product [Oppiella nova]|uniref:Uncharacterized protein n=1 Tax=Oppiella nova TaxID=334625 RepID=A0A7R9M0S1_9ACAR|nr:unnamed protein product [Oppiella nova]CAG2168233.1 unnamed protein product [Oppiella nova]